MILPKHKDLIANFNKSINLEYKKEKLSFCGK